MGMFDEYIPVPVISCPVCGQELSGWQGKAGPNLLLIWKQGERFPIGCGIADDDQGELLFDPEDHLPPRFEIYTNTCQCRRLVFAVGTCSGGRWTSTALLSRANAVPYSYENDRDFSKRLDKLEHWMRGAGQ